MMFTPQGKGWTGGWSTSTPANQRSGGGVPAASAPLGKGKGRVAELEQEVCSIFTFLSNHSPSV